MKRIYAVILASGFSKRAGDNKLLRIYKEMPMFEHIFKTLADTELEVLVVTRFEEIIRRANFYGYTALINYNAHLGQAESIKCALKTVNECMGYFFFPADQPNITVNLINEMLTIFRENTDKIICPVHSGTKYSPVLFPEYLKDKLLALSGDVGGKILINSYPHILVPVDNIEILVDFDY